MGGGFSKRDEAIVAVMGDLGRSPRMINHARELMKRGYFVNLIGFEGGKGGRNRREVLFTLT